jgi:hypothetical protein
MTADDCIFERSHDTGYIIEVVGIEDRSLSRRVVFKIRVKSLEQRGLEREFDTSAPPGKLAEP